MIIKVKVFEKETKEGKKFNTYKAVQNNGTYVDLKFTRAVTNMPTKDSIIEVLDENINYDTNRIYPCFWVKKIEKQAEMKKETKVLDPKLQKSFKYDDITDDDLPF